MFASAAEIFTQVETYIELEVFSCTDGTVVEVLADMQAACKPVSLNAAMLENGM